MISLADLQLLSFTKINIFIWKTEVSQTVRYNLMTNLEEGRGRQVGPGYNPGGWNAPQREAFSSVKQGG